VKEENGKKLTYDLTYKDVVDILEIIDHSTCRELHLELEDLKLTVIKRGNSSSPAGRSLEVRNIQRRGSAPEDQVPSTGKETNDSKKGR